MKQSQLLNIANDCAQSLMASKPNGTFKAQPFKYAYVDNFLPTELAFELISSFPSLSSDVWEHSKDVGIEVKSRTKWKSEFEIPDGMIDVIRILNSSIMLKAIGELLEIKKLMPDPYFSGGGLNVSTKGGHLDVHVDGNYHDASGMNRRVNLLLYLNPNWKAQWGGEFGIYSNDGKTLVDKISPLFNRCVVFDTHDRSFHGLPNPIDFPDEEPRRSIILYYYTVAPRPENVSEYRAPHSALWRSKGYVDKRGLKYRDYD